MYKDVVCLILCLHEEMREKIINYSQCIWIVSSPLYVRFTYVRLMYPNFRLITCIFITQLICDLTDFWNNDCLSESWIYIGKHRLIYCRTV